MSTAKVQGPVVHNHRGLKFYQSNHKKELQYDSMYIYLYRYTIINKSDFFTILCDKISDSCVQLTISLVN